MSAGDAKQTVPKGPAWLLATWFSAGLLPWAPGTWGSLAALPFAWLILDRLGWPWLLAAAALVFAAGMWASARYMRASGQDDPGAIVIDEVAGQFIALAAASTAAIDFAAGFVLFRLFDIVKPWPVNWAERRFAGGLGVMADDVLAGLYALAGVYLLKLMIG